VGELLHQVFVSYLIVVDSTTSLRMSIGNTPEHGGVLGVESEI
jgi:hypothetical protein